MFRPIVMSIRVPVETCRTADGVIVTCDMLDAACKGVSTDESMATLARSLSCIFESSFERGSFNQLFRSAGYSAQSEESWSQDGRFVDVRLTLSARHASLSRAEIDTGIRSALDRFVAA